MALEGMAGEVLYPSQGLFYFEVGDRRICALPHLTSCAWQLRRRTQLQRLLQS
jgi:hypothetical protein